MGEWYSWKGQVFVIHNFDVHYIMTGWTYVVAKDIFHHKNGNMWELSEWLNDEKRFFFSKVSYINKHWYLEKNLNHLKVKYSDTWNFRIKRALGEPTKHASVAKDSNSSHYLN